ncbi:MAG: RNA 3'-terminal phosphate cyclase [Anaerolineae bacterium]
MAAADFDVNRMLEIDGSRGEGGGQVLRTCLSLSALTGRPFRLTHIRANRSRPGLRPQHLTAVRAAAAICNASLSGDKLNATTLEFRPQSRPRAGDYRFDVSKAAKGGSAGAVTLVFQAVLWPLLFADEPSSLTLLGGTHVPFSPPYHYLAHVARPAFARLEARFETALEAWGWYPAGGGRMTAAIKPVTRLQAVNFRRAPIDNVAGIAAVTNLPAHIPQRMARRAHNLLAEAGLPSQIEPVRQWGRGPGAGIFLWLPGGGFSALGQKGLPADKVAETAVAELIEFLDNTVSVDKYLADQLLLPLALAHGCSTFTTHHLTQHTLTNARILRRWLDVSVTIDGVLNEPAGVTVEGIGWERVAHD